MYWIPKNKQNIIMSKKMSQLSSAWIKYFQKGERKTNEITRLGPNPSQKELPGMVYRYSTFNCPKASHFSSRLRTIFQLKGATLHVRHFGYLRVRTTLLAASSPRCQSWPLSHSLQALWSVTAPCSRIMCYWNETAYFRQSAHTKVCLQIWN